MVCSVPLLSEVGTLIGVCGFEISQMNFMLRHEPGTNSFHSEVLMLSMDDVGGIRLDEALFTGNSAVYSAFPKQGLLQITGKTGNLNVYTMPDGTSFVGISKQIILSPDDSPFAQNSFSATLLVPKGDFDAARNAVGFQFGLVLFVLILFGVLISIVISRRFTNPLVATLDALRSGNLEGVKTNVMELDQLIDEVKALRKKDRPYPNELFQDVLKRVDTLSPVETKIFHCFISGMARKDIMSAMFITKDAFRKHNERIYDKLGISDTETFMLYIELLKMSGQADIILSGADT